MKTVKLLCFFILITSCLHAQLQTINVGASANDKTGDPLRTAFIKCNTNFVLLRDTDAVHRTAINLNTAKVSFPGFGTNHTTAAYGDHNHSGIYLTINDSTSKIASRYWVNSNFSLSGHSHAGTYILVNDTNTKIATWKYVADHTSTYTASNGDTIIAGDIQFNGNQYYDIDVSGKHSFAVTGLNIAGEVGGSHQVDSTGFTLEADKLRNGESTFAVINGYNSISSGYPYIDLETTGKLNSNTTTIRKDTTGLYDVGTRDTTLRTGKHYITLDEGKDLVSNLGAGSDTAKYIKVINSTGGETPYYYKGIYSRQVADVSGYLNDLIITNRNDSMVFSILNNGISIKWGGGSTILNASLSTGRGIFTDTVRTNKALHIKGPIKQTISGVDKFQVGTDGQIKSTQISAALTDNTPTDSELDSATGSTPSGVGAGWQCFIKDSNGTGLVYRVYSDGTDWYYQAMTKAL